MNNIVLPFQEINPFIRHSHSFTVDLPSPHIGVMSYDYRMIYVIKGSGQLSLDNQLFAAGEGSLLYWPPGTSYSFLPAEGERFYLYGINFDFTCHCASLSSPIVPEKCADFSADSIVELVSFSDMPAFNAAFALGNMQSVEPLMAQINQEYNTKKIYADGKIRGYATTLFFDVARALQTTRVTAKTEGRTIDDIIDYIQDHYEQPLTNELLGKYFNYHPSYLSRLMVRYTGYSLHQYLIQYRVKMAFNLLQTTGATVTEVALKTGFSDINYFSRCFKKILGIRPKDC